MLYIVFVNYIFSSANNAMLSSYTDDTNVFTFHQILAYLIITRLFCDSKWFSDYLLKKNDKKFHVMKLGDRNTGTTIVFGNSKIKESDSKNLLGVTLAELRI